MNKKNQFFYLEFILAISLFLVVFFLVFNIISKEKIFSEENIEKEGEKISNYLLTEGVPKNWSNDDVLIIGITTNNSIDLIKLKNFYELCLNNYTYVKKIFSIKNDFFVYFDDKNNNLINFNIDNSSFSNICENKTNTEKNILTNTRYLVYRHDEIAEIIKMNVVVYD